jgi:hypothetical protein
MGRGGRGLRCRRAYTTHCLTPPPLPPPFPRAPSFAGFRAEVSKVYVSLGLHQPTTLVRTLRTAFEKLQAEPLDDGARALRYRGEILPHFPAVFHRWFLSCFPDPAAWLACRLTFTRSAAVWSMVGHVIGLGDRHGENLLLDRHTGECVHVDFDWCVVVAVWPARRACGGGETGGSCERLSLGERVWRRPTLGHVTHTSYLRSSSIPPTTTRPSAQPV